MKKLILTVLCAVLLAPILAGAADITQTSSNAIPTDEVARYKYYKVVWDNVRDACNTDIPALIADANTTRSALTTKVVTVMDTATVSTNVTIAGKWAIVGKDATTASMVQYGSITSTNGTGTVSFAVSFKTGTTPNIQLTAGSIMTNLYASSSASNMFTFTSQGATDGTVYWLGIGTRP